MTHEKGNRVNKSVDFDDYEIFDDRFEEAIDLYETNIADQFISYKIKYEMIIYF